MTVLWYFMVDYPIESTNTIESADGWWEGRTSRTPKFYVENDDVIFVTTPKRSAARWQSKSDSFSSTATTWNTCSQLPYPLKISAQRVQECTILWLILSTVGTLCKTYSLSLATLPLQTACQLHLRFWSTWYNVICIVERCSHKNRLILHSMTQLI